MELKIQVVILPLKGHKLLVAEPRGRSVPTFLKAQIAVSNVLGWQCNMAFTKREPKAPIFKTGGRPI